MVECTDMWYRPIGPVSPLLYSLVAPWRDGLGYHIITLGQWAYTADIVRPLLIRWHQRTWTVDAIKVASRS